MGTRDIWWPMHTADNLATCMYQLSRNSGSLNLLEPWRPIQTCIGIAFPSCMYVLWSGLLPLDFLPKVLKLSYMLHVLPILHYFTTPIIFGESTNHEAHYAVLCILLLLSPPCSKHCIQCPVFLHLWSFSCQDRDQFWHAITAAGKIIVL